MSLLLCLLHNLYLLYLSVRSSCHRLAWKPPLPLDAPRRRLPKHLALVISNAEPEDYLIDCATRAVSWCRFAGIQKLTVYDEHGVLLHNASRIEQRIRNKFPEPESDSSASEIEYPLTPPPSDYADSRPLSPAPTLSHAVTIDIPCRTRKVSSDLNVRKRRSHNCAGSATKPLTLCIISRNSAKPAVAAVACTYMQVEKQRTIEQPPQITANMLSILLECENGISPPDFMIVRSTNPRDDNLPLELHGFPPWHVRLTEIHYRRNWERPRKAMHSVLDEITFREALDEYAMAEFRFGR